MTAERDRLAALLAETCVKWPSCEADRHLAQADRLIAAGVGDARYWRENARLLTLAVDADNLDLYTEDVQDAYRAAAYREAAK